MSNRLTLPLLLLAALLAAGAFFWLSGDGRRPTGTPRAPEPTASAPADAPAAELAAPTQVDPLAPQPTRVAQETPAAPAHVARPDDDGARVAVQGQVLDRFGAPIALAKVTLGAQTGFPMDMALEEQFPWLARQRAETDGEGRFRFAAVAPGAVEVRVHASGFAPFHQQGLVVERADTTLAPFELARGAILSGIVVDPAGRGVAGAKLVRAGVDHGNGDIFFVGGREPSAVTAADGTFRIDVLACGPWRFVVQSVDHPDFSAEGIAEDPGVEVAGLRWELAPGATIAGTVTGVPAAERDRLEVRASRSGGDDHFFDGFGRTARVEPSGAFMLRGLDPGQSYSIKARRARGGAEEPGFFERTRSSEVQARSGDTGVVLAYQPEAAVTLTVLDARTKQPIEHLKVDAGIEWPTQLQGEDGKQRTFFPGGLVRVGGLRPASSEQRVTINLSATGYEDWGKSDIAVRAGQELDLGPVVLEPVPLVRVRVTDAKGGAPVEGASVRVTKEESGGNFSVNRSIAISSDGGSEEIDFGEGRRATTNADGWAEVTSFEGATVTVSVKARGYAPYRFPGLFLPRGEGLEHAARLTLGGEVLVTVFDADGAPLPAAAVAHRAPSAGDFGAMRILGGGPSADDVTDSKGQVRFSFLEAGLHGFRLEEGGGGGGPSFAVAGHADVAFALGGGGGDDWTEVEVGEGETAELTLRAAPRGGLEGRVREAGKTLAGATLTLEKEGGDDGGMAFMMPGMGGGGPSAKSDGEGRYRIADVKEGSYVLKVEHPTRRMPQSFPLEIRAGSNTYDVELPLSILEGRVTDANGKGVPGVRVWPERKPEEDSGVPAVRGRMLMVVDDGSGANMLDSGQFGQRAFTDADGRYTLRGVESDVELVVKAEGDAVQPGASNPVRLAPDEVRGGVDLRLDVAGSIKVETKLADGSPGRFQVVQASFLDESDSPVEPKFAFVQSGSTTLKGLKPGRWRVNVRSANAGPPSQGGGQEQEIEVQPAVESLLPFTVD
jgi:protocatechuate 3,4-dioxygenase beta subunit